MQTEAFMPQLFTQVLGPPTRAGETPKQRHAADVAIGLAANGKGLHILAEAMSLVAAQNGVALKPNTDGWQLFGGRADPDASWGVRSLTVTARMKSTYQGFDFRQHQDELHAAFREGVWSFIYWNFVSQTTVITDFSVRIEFTEAAGSDVDRDGTISNEYGGDTCLTVLEAPKSPTAPTR